MPVDPFPRRRVAKHPGMDLEQLCADPVALAAAFPVTAERPYLAHGGVAPLSGPARQALVEYATRGSVHSQERGWIWHQADALRDSCATLLGAAIDEIALIGPTALGLNLVALGLDWQPGDEVVYYPDDYPANVYPWAALEARGVTPVALRPERLGVVTWDAVEAALSERTRLVALASCHFLTGYRIDIDGIAARLQQRGIRVCLDAIQTLGAFPTPVTHVDFAAADSHKWLCGPCGAGLFYCARERHEELRPALVGALNIESPDFIAQAQRQPVAGARRYEPGTLNLPGIAAMQASLALLLELGVESIAARLLRIRQRLLDGARSAGWQPILGELEDQPEAERWRSGILSLTHPERDLEAVHRDLTRAEVITSLRHDRTGRAWLRLSPHGYTPEAQVDRVVELLG